MHSFRLVIFRLLRRRVTKMWICTCSGMGKETKHSECLLDLKDFPLLAVVGPNHNFLGITTRSDVLSSFQSAFGVNRPGVRIAFTSVETEGRIARLSEIAHQFHEHIISLVTFDETDRLVRRIVMKIEK
jgi:hypothetical protein